MSDRNPSTRVFRAHVLVALTQGKPWRTPSFGILDKDGYRLYISVRPILATGNVQEILEILAPTIDSLSEQKNGFLRYEQPLDLDIGSLGDDERVFTIEILQLRDGAVFLHPGSVYDRRKIVDYVVHHGDAMPEQRTAPTRSVLVKAETLDAFRPLLKEELERLLRSLDAIEL